MYENQKCGYKNAVRYKYYCRGPPDNRDMVHIIHNPNNHGVCPINKIKPQSTTE